MATGGMANMIRALIPDPTKAVSKVIEKLRNRKQPAQSIPLYDGIVLKLHYRLTFAIMLASFLIVTQQWYREEQMICRRLTDVREVLEEPFKSICMSYPYVEENGQRRYILFYRWIPWAFLLLTAVYYTPRFVSKKLLISGQLNDVLINARKAFKEENTLAEAIAYMKENKGTHNGIYRKYLALNIFSLFVDIFTMIFWHVLLQWNFNLYGLNVFTERKPEDFSDEISKTFPPFVKCTIEADHQLISSEKKAYGCHLTIMELYEKVFLILWFWLVLLIILTVIYIIYLMCMGLLFTPCVSICWQETKETNSDTVGDYYLRFRLKSHVSEAKCKHLFKYHFRNKPWISGIRTAKQFLNV